MPQTRMHHGNPVNEYGVWDLLAYQIVCFTFIIAKLC